MSIKNSGACGVNMAVEDSSSAIFFDTETAFTTIEGLLIGLREGLVLVHARVKDGTDFSYGIEPSAGHLLRSTEDWQTAADEHGDGPELIFFSDDLSWAKSSLLSQIQGRELDDLELVFVLANESIVQCCSNGRVRDHLGSEISYERCYIADFDSPLFKSIPAGVETGDWFTNRTQDVIAIASAADVLKVASCLDAKKIRVPSL